MSLDIEEQYDKIYRYCYFKLRNRETAEDMTQETFLRYLSHYDCKTGTDALKCMYTIARNLCVETYRRKTGESPDAVLQELPMEETLLTSLTVRAALSSLSHDEQELLLLRYVNDVPAAAIGELYGISRFAVYRRLAAASHKFRAALGEEDDHG